MKIRILLNNLLNCILTVIISPYILLKFMYAILVAIHGWSNYVIEKYNDSCNEYLL